MLKDKKHFSFLWNYWRYMGYSCGEVRECDPELATNNIKNLYSYCILLVPMYIIMLLVECLTVGTNQLYIFHFLVSILLGVLCAVISSKILKSNQIQVAQVRILTTVFVLSVYGMAFFYDIRILPNQMDVMICMAFIVLQSAFDCYPVDNLVITLTAFFTAEIMGFMMEPIDIFKGNLLNHFISVLCGMYISWQKSRGSFSNIINKFTELKLSKKEAQLRVMLGQIQPHFIYNILTTITALIGKKPEVAREAAVSFSDYLRSNLDSMGDLKPIPFKEELRHLTTYYSLEKIRFGDKIDISYCIETEDFSIPALTVEPLVENSIKYGVNQKDDILHIAVSTRESNGQIEILVEDDGPGFVVGTKKMDERRHVGLENVQSRLELVCNGKLRIESTMDVGTKAMIWIPKMNV